MDPGIGFGLSNLRNGAVREKVGDEAAGSLPEPLVHKDDFVGVASGQLLHARFVGVAEKRSVGRLTGVGLR